ncbi:MAG: hypothetical protein CVV21_08020 [Candidatus Goldiibacteriota bacterium HGW-Goldbacteria-1]|nr:MAG: hypothetical protein CVV21_08020 [Candidatus Goldiibacteriota bacterium HGW-Goldbacteria-1]
MKKLFFFLLTLSMAAVFIGCGKPAEQASKPTKEGKKVFIVDSYHQDYIPNSMSRDAALKILKPEGIDVQVFYLDSKNITDIGRLKQKAKQAVEQINQYKPDIILAFDDAASKYVIMPYFRNSEIPVVFNGVNWDEKQYGYPYKNATGQLEVELLLELIETIKKYSKGNKIAMLTGDTETDRDSLKYYNNILKVSFSEVRFVTDFDSWKKAFLEMQKTSDALFLRNNPGIRGWNTSEAESFVLENIKVITFTVSTHLEDISVISYAKDNSEFGEYSALTALDILNGKKLSEIPITKSHRAIVILNMKLAKKLGIIFPMEFIEQARFAGE